MRYQLSINGKDIGEVVKADGVSISSVSRNSKSVITMDGTLYSKEIIKTSIDVELLDMSDAQLYEYTSYFGNRLASITFVDAANNRTVTGQGYVKDLSYQVKKTLGTITYLTDISFSIEMK